MFSGEVDPFPFVDGLIIGWAVSFALLLVVGWRFIHIDRFIINFIPRLHSPRDKLKIKFVRGRQRVATPTLQSINIIDSNTMSSGVEKFASRMNFFELSEATDNFSEDNIVAIGETGTTYKATLSNGWCVAIKRLFNFPHLQHGFQSEITTLGRFGHSNLVSLVGFCHQFNDRLIVYKFMPNGSLHDRLSHPTLWNGPIRMKIAVGIAKGIAWLHQNRVVHRGISSKCVLLDENFDPKITDFGKATTPDRTYLSIFNGELSVPGSYEEDVYGFGMVLLELITGKKHEEFINTFESSDGDIFEIISELQATKNYDDEMRHLLRIARKCVQCDSGNWPSMVEVYRMLIGTTRDETEFCELTRDTRTS